jgi:hypothetical protein
MSPATAVTRHPLRCSHCGREINGTVHTRTTYHVDYYALHTGECEPVTLQRHDESMPVLTVLRLVRPMDVFTCVECYAAPATRAQREQLFRPEAMAESGDDRSS